MALGYDDGRAPVLTSVLVSRSFRAIDFLLAFLFLSFLSWKRINGTPSLLQRRVQIKPPPAPPGPLGFLYSCGEPQLLLQFGIACCAGRVTWTCIPGQYPAPSKGELQKIPLTCPTPACNAPLASTVLTPGGRP